MTLTTQIEGLLFVVGEEGLTKEQLASITGETLVAIEQALHELRIRYEDEAFAFYLRQTASRYRLMTKPALENVIEKLIDNPPVQALSQAALEVLAIVAYEQPVTRIDVEAIRGVKSERPLHTLAAKGLIREVGRHDGIGRAILYGTTDDFLRHFDLTDLSELPPLPAEEEEQDETTDLFMSKFEATFNDNEQES